MSFLTRARWHLFLFALVTNGLVAGEVVAAEKVVTLKVANEKNTGSKTTNQVTNKPATVQKSVPNKNANAKNATKNSGTARLKSRGTLGKGYLSYDRKVPNLTSLNGDPLPTPNILENILQMPTPDVVKANTKYAANFNIRQGCAPIAKDINGFLQALNVDDQSFEEGFKAQLPNFFQTTSGTCLPFALSLDGARKIQSLSIVNNDKRDVSATLSTIHRSQTSFIYLVDSQKLSEGFENYLEVILDLSDLMVYKANEASSSIPPELIWEISSLVKELYSKINSNERHFARIIYNAGNKNTWAQVISLEILDATQKNVLAESFWVNRDDLPGGFFTSTGSELEQSFWISPLNYTRISRGVGPSSVRFSKKRQVKDGKKNSVVTRNYTYSASHQGIDFAAPIGTPIYAVANGKIIHYGPYAAYGNLVIIEHPGNYITYYAHLSAYNPELEVGREIRRGLEIGYVGSTGRSTGPHLHFELRKNNTYLNPLASRLELDLWTLRSEDQYHLTRNIVLFSSQIQAK